MDQNFDESFVDPLFEIGTHFINCQIAIFRSQCHENDCTLLCTATRSERKMRCNFWNFEGLTVVLVIKRACRCSWLLKNDDIRQCIHKPLFTLHEFTGLNKQPNVPRTFCDNFASPSSTRECQSRECTFRRKFAAFDKRDSILIFNF